MVLSNYLIVDVGFRRISGSGKACELHERMNKTSRDGMSWLVVRRGDAG